MYIVWCGFVIILYFIGILWKKKGNDPDPAIKILWYELWNLKLYTFNYIVEMLGIQWIYAC